MAVRSGICLVCTVAGLLLRRSEPSAAMLWVVGAYLSGGWDLTGRVWQGLGVRECGMDFLMWLVAVGAVFVGGQLSSVLSPRLLKGIAGAGFVLIGLWTLLDLRAG